MNQMLELKLVNKIGVTGFSVLQGVADKVICDKEYKDSESSW